jgi:DNA-binding transcriptional LysR family regulator
MRFTLAQIEAFYWAARLGRFQDAARQLNLAQPTISIRIRDLEQTLKVNLFERLGRNVRLTNEGEVLLELSASILAEARRIHERVGNVDAVQGVLRLGLPENFAIACLPELVRLINRNHPGLRVDLAIGTSDSLLDSLEEHRIDAAVLANPQANPRLRFVPLGAHRMVWAAAPDIDLRPPIRPGDIRSLPIISNPPPAPQHVMIVEWFRSHGLSPLHVSTCTSVVVISDLVAAGVGLSLLPESLVRPLADAGRLRLLAARPEPPSVRVFYSYPASEGGSNVDAVLRSIRDVIGRVPFVKAT